MVLGLMLGYQDRISVPKTGQALHIKARFDGKEHPRWGHGVVADIEKRPLVNADADVIATPLAPLASEPYPRAHREAKTRPTP